MVHTSEWHANIYSLPKIRLQYVCIIASWVFAPLWTQEVFPGMCIMEKNQALWSALIVILTHVSPERNEFCCLLCVLVAEGMPGAPGCVPTGISLMRRHRTPQRITLKGCEWVTEAVFTYHSQRPHSQGENSSYWPRSFKWRPRSG